MNYAFIKFILFNFGIQSILIVFLLWLKIVQSSLVAENANLLAEMFYVRFGTECCLSGVDGLSVQCSQRE